MQIKRWTFLALGLCLGCAAHAQRYVLEPFDELRLTLTCTGKTFAQQERCEVTEGERGEVLVLQTKDKTLLPMDEGLKSDVSQLIQRRVSNHMGGLPPLSDENKKAMLTADAPTTKCMTGNFKGGGGLIWCSATPQWPPTLTVLVVGMAAVPFLMFKQD